MVIVGAGLGGCILADQLADNFDVTLIEMDTEAPLLRNRVVDKDWPATTNPHIASGLGGTTTVWHNGLIEIAKEVFDRAWPFNKAELAPYYVKAFEVLSGQIHDILVGGADQLLSKYRASGFSSKDLGEALYYPRKRINSWHSFRLKNRVRLVLGEVTGLIADGCGAISRVIVKQGDSDCEIGGDIFVLAAGGLGTPILLQDLAMNLTLPGLRHAGFFYEDHPCAVVGELVLNEPLYKMWNYPCAKGNLRLPFLLRQDGLQVSFQLRPSAQFRIITPSSNVKSVLSDLRNAPFSPRNYVRLLSHWDDIMDILSFKLGVHLPTYRYTVIMVAEQPPSDFLAVWGEPKKPVINRKWVLEQTYLDSLSQSIDGFLRILGGKVKEARIFSDWSKGIYSSSHHSGTARMGRSSRTAVCDSNGQVFDINNLFVCDGSAIPSSGYANTGLTIGALAIRMGDFIRKSTLPSAISWPVSDIVEQKN